MQDRKKIEFANSLRGLAALSVLISHYFLLFWTDRKTAAMLMNAPILSSENYITPNITNWLQMAPKIEFGPLGVALFFLISGFVIPFSFERLNGLSFLINRVFRIVPTYIFCFSVTLISIYWSSQYFIKPWPYSLKEVLIHYIPGLRDLFWTKYIDGIIWTLEVETKFYLVCAFLFILLRRKSMFVFLVPVGVFFTAQWVNSAIPTFGGFDQIEWRLGMTYAFESMYIIYMFIGVLFHYLYCKKIGNYFFCSLVIILFAQFIIILRTGPYSENYNQPWSYGFAIVLFALSFRFRDFFEENIITGFFADISYPLYAAHEVAGFVMMRIFLENGMPAWLALISVILLILSMAWGIHNYIEVPTNLLGRRLAYKFSSQGRETPSKFSIN